MIYKIKTKKARKSQPKVDKAILDESDIKLELHEDNGLNEDSEESERESKSAEEESPIEKSPLKNNALKSPKKQAAASTNGILSDIDEFIANGPRKPEKYT